MQHRERKTGNYFFKIFKVHGEQNENRMRTDFQKRKDPIERLKKRKICRF